MSILYNDKCTGALLAAAIGDALGWPFETRAGNKCKKPVANGQFQTWTRQSGGRFWSHTETIERGEYSDDTQLLLAVARSLQYGDKWNQYFVRQELPFWLSYERGGGNAIKTAARFWERHGCPWSETNDSKDVIAYFNAGANGVAMRILPHVIYGLADDDVDSLMSVVIRNGMYTHGHPRALLGATCYAYALYIAGRKTDSLEYGELVDAVLQGQRYWGKFHNVLPEWIEIGSKSLRSDYMFLWEDTARQICENLRRMQTALQSGLLDNSEEFLKSIGCFSPATNGAGDVSALTAIYLASKYAANPKQGIMVAAYLKNSDTDTNASMTGALLGMIQGVDWIPYEWQKVQDNEYILELSNKLLQHREDSIAYTNSQQNNIQVPIGSIFPIEQPKKCRGSNYTVTIQKYKTAWGQTLYIKNFDKNKNKQEVEQLSFDFKELQSIESGHTQKAINNDVLLILQELLYIDKKMSLPKLVKILSLILSTDLLDSEIAAQTKTKEKTVTKIRENCHK
ncbi:MAG: hypothetical protein HDT29_00825 [Clostridiales bacterium]|nr:hypothetical protein [Clostridiales bacterium]